MTLSLFEGALWLGEHLGAPGLAAAVKDKIAGAETAAWEDVIVERWLGPGEARVDIMGALVDPARLPDDEIASWTGHPLIAAWRASEYPLASSVLWAEWDRPERCDPESLVPLVSACVSDRVLGSDSIRRVPRDKAHWAMLCARCLDLLDLDDVAGHIDAMLTRLPPEGDLLHIASTAPRGIRATRLVFHIPAGGVRRWLEDIGWRGDMHRLADVLFGAAAPFENIGVQVEVRDGALGSYLGIESREYHREVAPGNLEAWRAGAVACGIDVSPDVLEHLRVLPGQQSRLAGGSTGRCHLYFKTATDGVSWQAKAYLGLRATGPRQGRSPSSPTG